MRRPPGAVGAQWPHRGFTRLRRKHAFTLCLPIRQKPRTTFGSETLTALKPHLKRSARRWGKRLRDEIRSVDLTRPNEMVSLRPTLFAHSPTPSTSSFHSSLRWGFRAARVSDPLSLCLPGGRGTPRPYHKQLGFNGMGNQLVLTPSAVRIARTLNGCVRNVRPPSSS